jgi:hypothetical protein
MQSVEVRTTFRHQQLVLIRRHQAPKKTMVDQRWSEFIVYYQNGEVRGDC